MTDPRIETMMNQLAAAEARACIAIEALMEIAAWGDEGGNARLAATGSYALFDEPAAVECARNAISRISP